MKILLLSFAYYNILNNIINAEVSMFEICLRNNNLIAHHSVLI